VTALLEMAAAAGIGILLGIVLMMTFAAAAISRSQERMERKVRYWQTETAHAREIADRLARQLAARDVWTKPNPRRDWE
jgi:hypothetical protein